MRKREKVKRLLALLLTVMMVFQQMNVITYAGEEKTVSDNIPTETPAAEPQMVLGEPQTQETSGMGDGGLSETSEPPVEEITQQEAAVPTEEAMAEPEEDPTTEPMAEPEVEPTAEPTAEPEAEPIPTEEAAAPVEEVTPTPEEIATPTPEPTANTFAIQSNGAFSGQVTLDTQIPEKAVFVVSDKSGDSSYYNSIMNTVAGYVHSGSGNSVVDGIVYDMHFELDGKEYPVNFGATVTISYNAPQLVGEGNVEAYHVKNGSVQRVDQSIGTNGDGSISSVLIRTESGFSPFAIVKTKKEQTLMRAPRESSKGDNVEDYITSVEMYENNTPLDLNNVDRNGEYKVRITFAESGEEGQFPEDGVMKYQLPNVLSVGSGSGELTITLNNNDSIHFGTYTISEDGLVTFSLVPEIVQEYNNIVTNFEFNAKFSIDENANQDKVEIVFSDNLIKEVTFRQDKDIEITKAVASDTYDPTIPGYRYTVIVKSNKGADNVKVVDKLVDELKYTGDVTITSNKNRNETIDYESSTDGKSRTFNIGTMEAGEEIKITYTADVDFDNDSIKEFLKDSNSKTYRNLDNTATVKVNDEDKDSANVKCHYDIKPIAKSNGEYNEKTHKAKWTITINEDKNMDLSNYTVTDALRSALLHFDKEEPGWIVVKKDGEPVNVSDTDITFGDKKGEGGDYETFTYKLPENAGHSKWEIVYWTTIDSYDGVSNINLYNKGTVTYVGGNGYSAEGYVGISGVGIGQPIVKNDAELEKAEVNGEERNYLKWVSTITIPESGYEKFEIKDWLHEVNNVEHVFEADLGVNDSSKGFGNITVKMTDRNGNVTYPNDVHVVRTDTGREFHLFFGADNKAGSKISGDIASIEIVYYSRIKSIRNQDAVELKNTMDVWVEQARAWDDGIYNLTELPDLTIDKADGSLNLEKGTISWKVFVNANRWGNVLRGKFPDGSLTITDILPEDGYHSFEDEGTIKVFWFPSYKDNDYTVLSPDEYGYTVSKNDNGLGFSVTFNNLSGLNGKGRPNGAVEGNSYAPGLCIEYATKINPDILNGKDESLDKWIFKNTAQLAYNGTVHGEATNQAELSNYSVFDKKLSVKPSKDNNYKASFTIDYNPGGLTMGTDENAEVIITDVSSKSLKVDLSSIQIKSNDVVIDKAQISYEQLGETNVLKITIPNGDGKHYVITYNAAVIGPLNEEIDYNNTATVEVAEFRKSDAVVDKVTKEQNHSGGATGSRIRFTLVKHNTDDISEFLAGAKFGVYKNADCTDLVDEYTTGLDGIVEIGGSKFYANTIYYLKELQAPDGYQLSDEVLSFVIDDGYTTITVTGYDEYIYAGEKLEIGNTPKPETTEVSGSKTWVGVPDGTEKPKVTIELYRNDELLGSQELKEDAYSFTELEKYDAEGNAYTYTVKEVMSGANADKFTGTQEGLNFTNTYSEKTEISGSKKWVGVPDGTEKPKVTIELY
ncbi:MAG: SpaA isopeptide-forming pilin-related protein, partial [Eubacteriales bacterium]|nr:SpaA isopeptide-forming pilin-related protein [Eubacteriales bacterium]